MEKEKKISTIEMRKRNREAIKSQQECTDYYQDWQKNKKKVDRIKKQLKDAIIGFGVATKILEDELRNVEDESLEKYYREAESEKQKLNNLFYTDFGIYPGDYKIDWTKKSAKEE